MKCNHQNFTNLRKIIFNFCKKNIYKLLKKQRKIQEILLIQWRCPGHKIIKSHNHLLNQEK